MRIVVYGEGPLDAAGESPSAAAVGDDLDERALGAAHVLVRRVLLQDIEPAPGEVRFVEPLRTVTGRRHTASDLRVAKKLRRLLAWPLPQRRPDFAVVLVDEDEDPSRRNSLQTAARGAIVDAVIAVPIREFEAWLIADGQAVATSLQRSPEVPPSPESLRRTEAKELLDRWIAESPVDADTQPGRQRRLRVALATRCNLAMLDRLSAFQQFRTDLRAVARTRSR